MAAACISLHTVFQSGETAMWFPLKRNSGRHQLCGGRGSLALISPYTCVLRAAGKRPQVVWHRVSYRVMYAAPDLSGASGEQTVERARAVVDARLTGHQGDIFVNIAWVQPEVSPIRIMVPLTFELNGTSASYTLARQTVGD
eukprot:2367096-Rhodomonas_salina.1